jgi:hypothetical protein
MSYHIDSLSSQLGVIFVFAERVAIDVKKMAFSYPFLPKKYDRLVKDAKRITKEQGAVNGGEIRNEEG